MQGSPDVLPEKNARGLTVAYHLFLTGRRWHDLQPDVHTDLETSTLQAIEYGAESGLQFYCNVQKTSHHILGLGLVSDHVKLPDLSGVHRTRYFNMKSCVGRYRGNFMLTPEVLYSGLYRKGSCEVGSDRDVGLHFFYFSITSDLTCGRLSGFDLCDHNYRCI